MNLPKPPKCSIGVYYPLTPKRPNCIWGIGGQHSDLGQLTTNENLFL